MKTASESQARTAGPMIGIETPYGAVLHFPETPEGLTFLSLDGGEPQRVRGALKRLLLTLLSVGHEAQARARVMRRALKGGTN